MVNEATVPSLSEPESAMAMEAASSAPVAEAAAVSGASSRDVEAAGRTGP